MSVTTKTILLLSFTLLFFACAKPKSEMSATKPVTSFQEFQQFAEEAHTVAETKNDNECDKNCQQLRQEFRYVVYVGKQVYCYWDRKKEETQRDFSALATDLEAKIHNDISVTDYYLLLRKWAAAFHDGHVNVLNKDDMSSMEIYTTPDLRLEVSAAATEREKVFVSESKIPGLQVGDEVVKLNGKPIKDAISEVETEVSGSTSRMRRFFGVRRLVDTIGIDQGAHSLEVQVAREGKVFTIARKVELNTSPGKKEDKEATGIDNLKVSILPGNIGYFRLDGFTGSQDDALIDHAMERLSKTSSLILDLRKNGGGDLSGDRILARLSNVRLYRYVTSENISPFVLAMRPIYALLNPSSKDSGYAEWAPKEVIPSKYYGDKKVVALISPNCFSACDTFVAGLKSNHLATLVGEGTGGGTGTPLIFELPVSANKFRYSIVRGKTSDGKWIEGNGTAPDVLVEVSGEDKKNNKDRALEIAIEMAGKANGTQSVDASSIASEIQESFEPIGRQPLELSVTKMEHLELARFFRVDEI